MHKILTTSHYSLHHLFCSLTYSPVHRQITASVASSIICFVTPPPWKSRSLKFTIVNSLNDKQYLYVQLYSITLKDYIVMLLIIISLPLNYWIPFIGCQKSLRQSHFCRIFVILNGFFKNTFCILKCLSQKSIPNKNGYKCFPIKLN